LLATAVRQARSGLSDAAERSAAQAMAANPLDPEPHVLLAALLAARDAFKQAETALRRALFLDPACIPALWQMGTLYRMTNRDRQAAYTFARLLARLEGLPPDKEALPFDNLTVNELATLLRAALGEPAHA
jgi:Flp pilus assembly protein TadD